MKLYGIVSGFLQGKLDIDTNPDSHNTSIYAIESPNYHQGRVSCQENESVKSTHRTRHNTGSLCKWVFPWLSISFSLSYTPQNPNLWG